MGIIRGKASEVVSFISSPVAMAKGIAHYLLNPEKYINLKSKCRETAEKHYSWERVTDQIEKIFTKIASDQNRNSRKG